jgi:FkbM family methyltransferase
MSVHHAVKDVLAALARPRDYTIVRRNQRGIDRLAFANHMRRQFDRLQIGCVLDVGANRGQYRDLLRGRVGYTGRIVSFEPIVDLASFLRDRAAAEDPGWDVCPYALGAAEEQRDLHVMRGRNYSSFFRPAAVAAKAHITTRNVVERVERVRVRRLDDVVAEGLLLGPGGIWLKVDTQGWDLEVLRGATRTMHAVSALQIELSVIPIYQGMPDYLTVLGELRRLGFEIGALMPLNRDALGRVIEFDCALVAAPERVRVRSIGDEADDDAVGPPSERLKGKGTSGVQSFPHRQMPRAPSDHDLDAAAGAAGLGRS